MTKENTLKKYYTKSESSKITKTLFTALPIAGAFLLPIAHGIDEAFNDGGAKTNINYLKKFGLQYDDSKTILDSSNLKNIGLTAFTLLLPAQAIHSAKNLYTKWNQSHQKIIKIDVDGQTKDIVAKSTLPISTYLADISLIVGAIGYFAMNDSFWPKLLCGAGGVLGNIIFKACADDSTESVFSQAAGMTGLAYANVNSGNNSNNVNIGSNNTTYNFGGINTGNKKTNQNEDDNAPQGVNNSEIDPAAILLAAGALVGTAYVGSYLISDSTPGNYIYKFYDKKTGEKLGINLEWSENDNSYTLYNEYGEEIAVIS
jgi:hypothetical protein